MNTNPLLSGIRVLDLSRLLPGPFATLYLAQLGAEVIKIEEPGIGDYARQMPGLFEQVNRGKKSVVLDLREPDDVERFKAMSVEADVVVDTFRPDVMRKLGCDYDTLKALNPRLVYAALTGYGHSGPYRNRPGHDMNYRGYAGELAQNAPPDGTPLVGDFQVADLAGGALSCVIGILAALNGVRASGQGCFVDVAMLDCTLALQVATLAELRDRGKAPRPGSGMLSGAMPNYNVYQCADGRHLALGAFEHKFFANFCRLADRADLLELPYAPGAQGQPLREAVAALVATRTRDDWEALMADQDTCASAILSMDEVLQNAQVCARELVQWDNGKPAFGMPIRFDGQARPTLGPSPTLGQDNETLAAR
ncbi:CoA transferase [Algiphilus sp. W345]|uniref:CoA transferase n=1 Tax=Banduia mediterranea TaxID=3075609 RepID=A0ABU2WE65_9GAMM|nr:CoA transferase [Algiphilus sp. W345]MDT0496157.1 CoA transferase [Algiphilus sp. W345]